MDVEAAAWHYKSENHFAVSTEAGIVLGYDSRKINEPLFTLQAHESACSSVQFSPHFSNMMVTSSTD
jgi:periodic tryptophan protein 1